MSEVIFVWIEARFNNTDKPYLGPEGYGDYKAIGKNYYHSLDELLKAPCLTDSLKKKLKSAKPGTRIHVMKAHSYANLVLKRLTDDEVSKMRDLEALDAKLFKLNEELKFCAPNTMLHKEEVVNKIVESKEKLLKDGLCTMTPEFQAEFGRERVGDVGWKENLT